MNSAEFNEFIYNSEIAFDDCEFLFNGEDILIYSSDPDDDDGSSTEDYIQRVGDGVVGVAVHQYDEDGEMYDESIDNTKRFSNDNFKFKK